MKASAKYLFCALSLAATIPLSSVVIAHDTSKAPMDMAKMAGGSGELHKAMMDGMRESKTMKMSGNTDKDFAAMMIQHHQQALAMAKIEIDQGTNPDLKAMAQKMYDMQKKEIEELKGFTK